MPPKTAYDDLDIRGIKLRVERLGDNRGNVFATLVINNKGRQMFRKGRLVVKVAPHQENQTGVWVWPYGPTTKEIMILRDSEVPRIIKAVDLQMLFFDPSKERGLSVGGRIFDRVDFSEAEVEFD
tara:strand:+ start:1125 stop:1499 length:375 start_codon:yes stop_codon:yes gene_type:complete